MDIINWKQIKEKINTYDWAKDIFDTLKKDVDDFILSYHDDVNDVAGWGHHFHCTYCSGRLLFDINSRKKHICSICGKENEGNEGQDNSWTATYRGKSFGTVYNAAILYNIEKDEKYIDYIKKVLNFFADNYEDFKAWAPAKRFEGKLVGINLSDATHMIQVMFGLSMTKGCYSKEELDKWHDQLFVPQAAMYDQFSNKIYNIPVWMKCAEGIIGIFFNDEKMIENAFYSRFGIMDQLRRGVTEDGMWFEASTHYHFYCVQPITYLLYFAKKYDLQIKDNHELYDYVENLYMFTLKNSFRNGKTPNPCDGWPGTYLEKYRGQYEYAALLFDNEYFKQLVGTFYKGSDKPGVERLLFNAGYDALKRPDFGSNNFEDSFEAMLKNDITELFIKTGIKTICHAHPDVMTIELCFYDDLVSTDLSSNGYGSRIFQEWQRKSISHNTVVLNKMDQKYEPVGEGIWPEGIVEYYDESRIRAKSKNVYECCDYTRDITIDGNAVHDEFLVKGVEDYTIDWCFYCKGEAVIPYAYDNVDSIGDSEGYEHLFDIRSFSGDNDWQISFELSDKTVLLDMKGEKGTTVYVVNSYTESFKETRYGVIVRRTGNETLYDTTYTCQLK
ncbi:MAG: alginate lyase family protein [Clostridia bacterium]|nr:alginate lyase family protein [Clostridia bacterium]